MFMHGRRRAAAARSRRPRGRGGGGVQPATTVNAADLEYFTAIGARVPRTDRPARARASCATPGGRVLRVRLLPVRRAVVLDARLGPAWRRPAGRAGRRGRRRPAQAPARARGHAGGDGAAWPAAFGQRGARPRRRSRRRHAVRTATAREGIDLRLLQWMDARRWTGSSTWTPFKHPTLGDVEIGGFKPYVTVNPPAAKIAGTRRGAREVRRCT